MKISQKSNLPASKPSVCVLTQTASDISSYYRNVLQSFDLYFITYKTPHKDAICFLPDSTWSHGRNRLWEHVKGQYDYYLFIDDDLRFFYQPGYLPLQAEALIQQMAETDSSSAFKALPWPFLQKLTRRKLTSTQFRKFLVRNLKEYNPMVATIRNLNNDITSKLDWQSLRQGQRVRATGWFDPQFSIFSEVAARLLLPYDVEISGWWSAQIPIYLLSHLMFKDRSLTFLNIGAQNMEHTVYRPGYDGYADCELMLNWLASAISKDLFSDLAPVDGQPINIQFAFHMMQHKIKKAQYPSQPTEEEVLSKLHHSCDLNHPYIFRRHEQLIEQMKSLANIDLVNRDQEAAEIASALE